MPNTHRRLGFDTTGGARSQVRSFVRGARLAPVLLLTVVLALPACGGDAGNDATGSVSGQDADAFPVTMRHKLGSAKIAQAPKRIVAVGYNDADFLLALGAIPVGTRGPIDYPYANRPWAREALDGAEPQAIGSETLNFEKIAALRPDLIVGIYSGMTDRDYSKLSRIAPTVAQSDRYVDFGMPWQAQLELTGRAIGREDRARDLVAQVEQRFAAARREHPEFDGTSAVLASRGSGRGYFAFTGSDLRMNFFTSLGFKVPAQIDRLAGKRFYAELSPERVKLLDQDVLIMFGDRRQVERDPVFRRLDAVREGRVVYVPTGRPDLYGALNYNSPLSLPFQLDGFVPRLAAAVDGKRATAVAPIR